MDISVYNLSIIDLINKNSKIYPEVAKTKEILTQNGINFETKEIDLEKLKHYVKSTSPNGILMPTKEDIVTKVYLSQILFPQKTGNKINYLFGKGIGVEIALMGQCRDRKSHNVSIEPRSHSDFELYDVKESNPYEKYSDFKDVFAAQEYFAPHQTKGLINIPDKLLDDTHEVVDFYGLPLLVPCLEILYVDKMIKRESTPREFGLDAEALSTKYDLDVSRCKKILTEFYMKPETEKQKKIIPPLEKLFENVKRLIMNAIKNDDYTNINIFNNIAKISKKSTSGGIPTGVISSIDVKDLVDGELSKDFIGKATVAYEQYVEKAFATQKEIYDEILKDLTDKKSRTITTKK